MTIRRSSAPKKSTAARRHYRPSTPEELVNKYCRASCERCGTRFTPVKPARGPIKKLCDNCGSPDGRLGAYLARKGKQSDLFIDATPVDEALEVGLGALGATASKNAELLDRLKPIARQLAERSPNGITVSDVRKAAERAGLLNGKETKEELCCLGAVMKGAGLKATGQMRRSHLESTHGRHQLVWRI